MPMFAEIFAKAGSFLGAALPFLIALGILVAVHEWGHYIVAKLSGVWVEKFSLGFGPKIIGFHKNGTDYRIAPIPLGGYVKLYGQDPWEEAGGDAKKAEEIANDPRAFHSKPMSRKLATVLAGPMMNLVLCLLIMPVVFMVGRLQPKILDQAPVVIGVSKDSPAVAAGLQKGDRILSFDGVATPTWQELLLQIALHPDENVKVAYEREGKKTEVTLAETTDKTKSQVTGWVGIEPFDFYANEPLIDTVNTNSPAAAAGLKAGDRIVSIDGTPVEYWTDLTKAVQKSEGKALSVTVARDGAENALTVTPMLNADANTQGGGVWIIGVTKRMNLDDFVKKRHGLIDAFKLGFKENLKLLGLTLDVVKRLFTGDLSYKALGGPLQIAKATSSAAESGFGEFLYLLSFLSLQLGVLNLLPVPVLDGGHVVFMLLEAARRKPLSPRVRQVSTQIGLVMLLGLMVLVTFNDISSIIGFGNIFKSITGLF